jgi:hypothetical protein
VAGGQPTAQGELQKAVPDQIRLYDVLCGGVRLRARRRDHLAKFSGSGGRGGLMASDRFAGSNARANDYSPRL